VRELSININILGTDKIKGITIASIIKKEVNVNDQEVRGL